MQKAERYRRQKLDSVVDRMNAAEHRALADLRAAGFQFKTIEGARRYREKLRTADRFKRDYNADPLAAADQIPDIARRTA